MASSSRKRLEAYRSHLLNMSFQFVHTPSLPPFVQSYVPCKLHQQLRTVLTAEQPVSVLPQSLRKKSVPTNQTLISTSFIVKLKPNDSDAIRQSQPFVI